MNIIEAIKSGKLHKRKINREWCHPVDDKAAEVFKAMYDVILGVL